MKYTCKNTKVEPNIRFNEDKTRFIYDLTTEIYPIGSKYTERTGENPYPLVTMISIKGMECSISDVHKIEMIAKTQAEDYVSVTYPEII